MCPSNNQMAYPSGAAALFACHAREEKTIIFRSVASLLDQGAEWINKGDLVKAVKVGSGDYSISINDATEPDGYLPARWINILAGKKLVEE